MRGKFITIEGTEGVGKTTNIEFIQSWMDTKKLSYSITREPGGTPLAEQIRELLLAPREESVSSTAELLLVFAARAQHLNQVIEPMLGEGAWVVCDRFTDVTYAYQGAGRLMRDDLIRELELLVQGSLQPDLTLILDIQSRLGSLVPVSAVLQIALNRSRWRFLTAYAIAIYKLLRTIPSAVS